jgi:hypothetical protein
LSRYGHHSSPKQEIAAEQWLYVDEYHSKLFNLFFLGFYECLLEHCKFSEEGINLGFYHFGAAFCEQGKRGQMGINECK